MSGDKKRQHAWDDPFIRGIVIATFVLAIGATIVTAIWGK